MKFYFYFLSISVKCELKIFVRFKKVEIFVILNLNFKVKICEEGIRFSCKQWGDNGGEFHNEYEKYHLICESIHDKKNICKKLTENRHFEPLKFSISF